MRQKQLLLVVFATATVVLACSIATWAADPKPVINYLPLGDSNTAFGRYFAPLNNLLTSKGFTPNNLANEGHSGFIIQGAQNGAWDSSSYDSRPWLCLSDAPRAGLAENIDTYMNHPGVNAANSYVLLMIGTNDVDTGYKLNSADNPNARTRLSTLITSVTEIVPLSHVIVAKIVPLYDGGGGLGLDGLVRQFNTDVDAAVAAAQAAHKNVTMVDMYTPFHTDLYPTVGSNPYMGDRWHPNDAGGTLLAQAWADGIQAASVPEPGTIALLITGGLALLAFAWRRRK